VLCREVHPQGGRSGELEFLVQFGEWFNIKPSRAGSLTLNHFEKSSLILNHSGEIV
jgi:hypothetical protein